MANEKLNIYHFAHPTYGKPFLEYYQKLPQSIKDKIIVHIVFSLKGFEPKGSKWMIFLRKRYHYWKIKRVIRRITQSKNIIIILVENVKETNFIKKIKPNSLGICTGFNQIFSKQLIGKFSTFINVHPSILPYYRGPIPSYWCLKNKEKYSGYTIHKMTEKIDEGEVLFQEIIKIGVGDNETSLNLKIAHLAKVKLFEFLLCYLEKNQWTKVVINPDDVYKTKIGYLSFAHKNK